MQVHYETRRQEADYVYTRKGVEHKLEQYSVEVTVGTDRRRVSCGCEYMGRVTIFGLAVKFSQGAKVWDATATYWLETGVVNHIAPRIDKRGYFVLVGYFEDFADKKVASQHNGA